MEKVVNKRLFLSSDIDYIRHKSKNIGQEFISIIRYFHEKVESDLEFFFASEVDHAGTLRSIFWAEGRAISSYLSFSNEVVFNTTYKTNIDHPEGGE